MRTAAVKTNLKENRDSKLKMLLLELLLFAQVGG